MSLTILMTLGLPIEKQGGWIALLTFLFTTLLIMAVVGVGAYLKATRLKSVDGGFDYLGLMILVIAGRLVLPCLLHPL